MQAIIDVRRGGQDAAQLTVLVTKDGALYTGAVSSKRHGDGRCKFSDGRVYEGSWVDDVCHGHGKMTFPCGKVYEGEWANGMRSSGKMTYANGPVLVYDGQWANNSPHGIGKVTYAGGYVYDGELARGKRCGQGKMTFPDGAVY